MAQALNAQEYSQLIITKIRHSILMNSSYNVNSKSFPCYFNDPLFRSDIADTITNYIGEKLSVDTVIFSEQEFAQCNERYYPIKIKPFVPYDANTNNLYMSLSTAISYRRIEYQEVFYQLSADMRIVDGRNKKVFKAKTIIPFVIRESEGIVSDTLMHKNDFEIFYLDALAAAFGGKSVTLGKRFIFQPLTHQYDHFLLNASDYILQKGYTDFAVEKEDGERIKILDIEATQLSQEELASLFAEYKVINRFKVTPVSGYDKYEVDMRSKSEDTDGSGPPYGVEIKVSGNFYSGLFYFKASGTLSGTWNKDTVDIQWKAANSISEVRINKQLVAIIHYRSDGQHLYYRHDLYPNKLAKVVFLVFLYNEAENVVQNSLDNSSDYYSVDDEFLNYFLF
jgi:hypothetical protein